jgi:hypothetical protein
MRADTEYFCLTFVFFADLQNFFSCHHEKWISIDNNSCFYVSNISERADWHEAENICSTKKAHLVSIHDINTNQLILNYTQSSKKYWIGLNSLESRGTYVWSDGTSRDYDNFNRMSSTKNPQSIGRCVYLESLTGIWKYNYCNDDKLGFICLKSDFNSNSTKKNNSTPIILNGNCPSGN